MADKDNEKNLNTTLEAIDDDELEIVSGGRGNLNPPRVDVHDYDDDVKGRM